MYFSWIKCTSSKNTEAKCSYIGSYIVTSFFFFQIVLKYFDYLYISKNTLELLSQDLHTFSFFC